jgi:hypothetical protein
MCAGDDAERQESVGAGWTIKHNTLNVNRKDLKYHQLEPEKNGWTVWERTGFTRFSSLDQFMDAKSDKDGDPLVQPGIMDDSQPAKLSMLRDLAVGFIDPAAAQLFERFAVSIWEERAGSSSQCVVIPTEFLHLSAERFRASHQKLGNASTILNAIFVCADPAQLTHLDFAKFGPEETLIQKLDSLLKSSNQNHNWLKLSRPVFRDDRSTIYGYFDEREHNCFVLRRAGHPEERFYNLMQVPATSEYLVDAEGRKYASWQHYFESHPVSSPHVDGPIGWPQFDF